MAVREYEIKADTTEAVESVEKLREELVETEKTVEELEAKLKSAGRTAADVSREQADQDRELARAKKDIVREIDRATGGYIQLGEKAFKAYKIVKSELGEGILKAKEFFKTFSLQALILSTVSKIKMMGQALKLAFTTGANAAKILRTALVSTGIGALVVALGMIVAYWDDIKGAITGASKELKGNLEIAEQNVQAQQAALDALSLQENALRLQGKSEKEIRDLKIQQTEETIKALEAQLIAQKQLKDSQVAAAKRNRDILQGVIQFIAAPLTLLLTTVDAIGSALGQDFGLEKGFSQGLANMVFDPDEIAKEGDEAIEETEKQLAKLKSTRDGYLLDEKKDRDAAAKQRLDDAKKLADDLRKLEEETAAIRSEIYINAAKDEEVRENRRYVTRMKQLGLQRKQELAAAQGNAELTAAIKAKYQALIEQEDIKHTDALVKIEEDRVAKIRAIADKVDEIDASLIADAEARELAQLELKYQKEVEAAAGQYDLLEALQRQHEKNKADIQDEYDKKELEKKQKQREELRNLIVDSANATIENLLKLNDIYDKDDEDAARRAFERSKKLQTLQAIINTAAGIMGQLAVPQDQLTGANFVKAAVIAATGATQIATIQAAQFTGGKSSGGKAPTAPAAPAAQPNLNFNLVGASGVNQLAAAVGSQFNQPIRAYVVGSEVNSAQEMERKRIRTASFG